MKFETKYKSANVGVRAVAISLTVVSLGLTAAPAFAVPDASVYASAAGGITSASGLTVGTYTVPMSCSGVVCSSAQTSVSYVGGDAIISAAATSAGTTNGFSAGGQAQGAITYYVDLLGPTNAPVDLVFNATQSTSTSGDLTGYDSAVTRVELQDGPGVQFNSFACSGNLGSCPGGSSTGTSAVTNLAFTAYGGDRIVIFLDALSQTYYGPADHTVTANIDPMLTFATGVAPAGFALGYSADLGGPAFAVPEPETYLMMLTGLAALSSIARRRTPL